MNVLISGASGFVGKALYVKLKKEDHNVKVLSRRGFDETGNSIQWNLDQNILPADALENLDAVVNLSGASIATRWNKKTKQKILDSRVKSTTLLSNVLASLKNPPKVLINASAVGYYGNRGDELLKETSAPTQEFLSTVCQAWENATQPAVAKGIRVVNLRFGIILGAGGGALCQMVIPFKLGIGGKVGSGKQYMSWISLDDVVGVIEHAISKSDLKGPVNTVAPQPVTNEEFTATLGKVLCRPTLFPVPPFAARLLMGEAADGLMLASERADSSKLTASGYVFKYPELEEALRAILK